MVSNLRCKYFFPKQLAKICYSQPKIYLPSCNCVYRNTQFTQITQVTITQPLICAKSTFALIFQVCKCAKFCPSYNLFFTEENSKYITQIVSKLIDLEIWARTGQISVQSQVSLSQQIFLSNHDGKSEGLQNSQNYTV